MSGILGVVSDVDYIMQIPCYFISAPVDIPVALKVSTSKAANKNKRPRNLNHQFVEKEIWKVHDFSKCT